MWSNGSGIPHVENADIAKKLVSYCLYPPKGHRSMTGVLPQLDFKQQPIADVASTINKNMLIVIMLESPEAIDNVDSIAAIDGVDVILIGTMICAWRWVFQVITLIQKLKMLISK